MSTTTFRPAPRIPAQLSPNALQIPPPETLKEATKGPWWQRAIPALMGVMMLAMIIIMFRSGGRNFSPYMMMVPLSIAMGAMGYLGVGGHGNNNMGEVDAARKDYYLRLRELRREVQGQGEAIHKLHRTNFPHPDSLSTLIGQQTMWTATGGQAAKDEDGPQLSPYLTARLGVGIVRMWPALKRADIQIPENMEPLTTIAHTQFLRNQNFIPNTPIGLSLRDHPFYSFAPNSDQEMVASLGRAMIASLAYNHSPQQLAIGIVSDPLDGGDWDWMKWLPNVQDPSRFDASGNARMAWRSLSEFAADMAPVINERGQWSSKSETANPHYVIFIDAPGTAVGLPPGIPSSGVAGMTFVILRNASEALAKDDAKFHVSAKDRLSTRQQIGAVTPDQLSILGAEVIAQKLSKYRPKGWSGDVSGLAAIEEEVSAESDDMPTYFEVLGITDINKYDPRETWRKNATGSNFRFPLGFLHDGAKNVRELVTLDIGEQTDNGSGPHGVVQGQTGSGKSFLLTGMVLTLCAMFPPDKLNLILMDFKGGATFQGFEKLPHVIASMTNLESEADMVDRAGDVIRGEIAKRMNHFKEYKDIRNYRMRSDQDPVAFPPMPDIVIIADEFQEFLTANSHYLEMFAQIGRVGRSLGMHAMLCSQTIDASLLRDMMTHLTYFISLRVNSGGISRALLGTEEASRLPGAGHGIVRYNDPRSGEHLNRFLSFNVEQRYVPPTEGAGPAVIDAEDFSVTDVVTSFTLSNDFAQNGDMSGGEDPDSEALTAARTGSGEFIPDDVKMKNVLIERISQFNEVKALELWKPTLHAPLTFADIPVEQATTTRLEFRIGDIDAPFEHTRYPWYIRPESGDDHVLVVGGAHSGRSTAVEAMIASSAMSYPARMVSWYLIDYGGTKLSEVSNMPNVGAYASNANEELIERLLGEAARLCDIRTKMFQALGVSTLDAYFAAREQTPVPDDPYGHFFLVIDNILAFLPEHDPDKTRLKLLLERGGRYGIHVVATVENEVGMIKINEYFTRRNKIYMYSDNRDATNLPLQVKNKMTAVVPSGQPGRAFDFNTQLGARVLVPQMEKIEPVGYDTLLQRNVYDHDADYSANIRRLSDTLRQSYLDAGMEEQLAPAVDTVPAVVDYDIMWTIYDQNKPVVDPDSVSATRRRQLDIQLPVAISAEDLTLVQLPQRVDRPTSPHLVLAGDPASAKTAPLRSVINSIVRQMGPDEAQIVLADSRYEFLPEKDLLEEMGYLFAFANNKTTFDDAMTGVDAVIRDRAPSLDITSKERMERSWYTGPEFYVLVDNLAMFTASGAGGFGGPRPGLDVLADLVREDAGQGLHVFVTTGAARFVATRQTNKLLVAVNETNAPTALLSGSPGEGSVFTGVKFKNRRPGEALLFEPATEIGETVQFGYARSWAEPDAAPSADLVARAAEIKATLPIWELSEAPETVSSGSSPGGFGATAVSAPTPTTTAARPDGSLGRKWGDPPV